MTFTLEGISDLIATKRGEFKAFYDSLPQGKDIEGAAGPQCTTDDIAEFKRRNDELNDLVDKKNAMLAAQQFVLGDDGNVSEGKIVPANIFGGGAVHKSLASELFEHPRYKSAKTRDERDHVNTITVDHDFIRDIKATVTTTSGYPPFVQRTGDVVPAISRPPQLIDFLTMMPTTQTSLSYMTQSARTNAAVEVAEAGALAESTLVWTNATDVIRRIGTYIPVTEEQLEDEPGVASLINNDLVLMTRQRLDLQVTAGNGSGNNLTGILNRSGIQTQAKGSESSLDAIGSAIAKVQLNAYSNPNIAVMHVTDMWSLAKLKDVTSGQYLLADPTNFPAIRAWGLTIVRSEGTSQGTAIVLDSSYFKVAMRKEVEVGMGWQNDDFVKNQRTVRAYCRAGLLSLRDSAACKVTGL